MCVPLLRPRLYWRMHTDNFRWPFLLIDSPTGMMPVVSYLSALWLGGLEARVFRLSGSCSVGFNG